MRPIVKKIAWPPNQWKSVYVDDILDDSRSAVTRKPFLSHGFYHSLLDNAPNSASKEEVKNDLVPLTNFLQFWQSKSRGLESGYFFPDAMST